MTTTIILILFVVCLIVGVVTGKMLETQKHGELLKELISKQTELDSVQMQLSFTQNLTKSEVEAHVEERNHLSNKLFAIWVTMNEETVHQLCDVIDDETKLHRKFIPPTKTYDESDPHKDVGDEYGNADKGPVEVEL